MNITLSLNEEARTFYEEDPMKVGYIGSLSLSRAFINRGHNLSIVHPNDVYKDKGYICARKIYGFNNRFYKKQEDLFLFGDVFFVYGLGEDQSLDISKRFMDSLYTLENQFRYVLNNAESTSYEYKPKQKTLNVPWIPGFEIKTKDDLVDLVNSGEKIIAKPNVGYASRGIRYLEKLSDTNKIPEDQINSNLYEKYIPANEERRYIFLDKELIIRRRMIKSGEPGNEISTSVDLMEGYNNEIVPARNIITSLGMFYGAVDFRGEYVLEINGSGTGIAPPTISGQEDPYNLSSVIVQAVERRVNRTKNETIDYERANSI